jgi:lipid-A-disaccharide synthase
MKSLLVVAGEASGDRAAAGAISWLGGVHVFGLGGPALARVGVDLLADLRCSTALGFGEVAARTRHLVNAWRVVTRAARLRRPSAALLVDYTEFNTLLASELHAASIPVIWYGAPQVWAWRPRRARKLGRLVAGMAVMLPFEEALWRSAGVDARYVGHPALEPIPRNRVTSRRILSIPESAVALGILPGSRPHEVTRLLPRMIEAWVRLSRRHRELEARVVLAPSLDAKALSLVRAACLTHDLPTFEVNPLVGAAEILSAFDVVLCASGTASLEAALAHAPPVVAYRVGFATGLVARALLRSPYVALPNVLLERHAFPELLQYDATAERMAAAVDSVLSNRNELLRACDAVTDCLKDGGPASENVARMVERWL